MRPILNNTETLKLQFNGNEVYGTIDEIVQNHQLLASIKEYVNSGFCTDKTIINLIETTNSDYEISENKPIKYVLFDLGGVVFNGSIKNFCMWCFHKYGFTPKFMDSKVSVDHRMDTGEFTIYDFLKEQNPELPEEAEDTLLDKWANTFRPNHKILEIISDIDKSTCNVGALSNIDRYNGKYYTAQGYFKDFDKLFFSYKMKMVKPDNRIFLNIIKELQLDPREILFIDDQVANIEAAKRFSFNTLLFTEEYVDSNKFIYDLNKNGVKLKSFDEKLNHFYATKEIIKNELGNLDSAELFKINHNESI